MNFQRYTPTLTQPNPNPTLKYLNLLDHENDLFENLVSDKYNLTLAKNKKISSYKTFYNPYSDDTV